MNDAKTSAGIFSFDGIDRASRSDAVIVAVGLQPTVAASAMRCVAERRLKSTVTFLNRRSATQSLSRHQPWAEAHGYLRMVAPRPESGTAITLLKTQTN